MNPNPLERQRQARFTILSLLAEMGKPASFLEIGFNASPQVLKNMAAHGLIRITVETTDRGHAWLADEIVSRKRKTVNTQKEKRVSGGVFGNPHWSGK